jgi:hypothetical protein
VVVVDSESLEVLFDSQNLISAKNVLMSAHHLSGARGPPFDPLRLFRFKIVLFLKGYRSQRVLEGEAARAPEKARSIILRPTLPTQKGALQPSTVSLHHKG